jgi:fucose permease
VPYALLGILATGVEVGCGTWLITDLGKTGFTSEFATVINGLFYVLFAASRLVIAPFFIWLFDAKPAQVIITGSVLAAVSCANAVWDHHWASEVIAVCTIAVCTGPCYAATITMANQRAALTSADAALFSVASSIGTGGVPFVLSRFLAVFGPGAFFPALGAMSLAMLPFTLLLAPRTSKRSRGERLADEYDQEAAEKPGVVEKRFSVTHRAR